MEQLNQLRDLVYSLNKAWWSEEVLAAIAANTQPLASALVAQKLCLIHSEISEAMEGHRKNLQDDKLPHRKMLEVELADALIRILDLCGALNLDIGGAVEEKLEFNKTREDHTIAARNSVNGKSY